MLLLYENAAGFAIFKVLDEEILQKSKNLETLFETGEVANKIIQLELFRKFANSHEALEAAVALNEGKICKPLFKFLKKVYAKDRKDKLLVWDHKLGISIKDTLKIDVTSRGPVTELMRCIKIHFEPLIPGISDKQVTAMALGIAHNLARSKLQITSEKVDTMVIQSVKLLKDMDKQIISYCTRVRDWYGCHFPELSKMLPDNMVYIKAVLYIGNRENIDSANLTNILKEDIVVNVKKTAIASMGTEISTDEVTNIWMLCKEIEELEENRVNLNLYITNRMAETAPNLSIVVGEFLGAELITLAGSLMNLAKLPASTIQVLGAGKRLFSALKDRKSTPKCGIIYNSKLLSEASEKAKGNIARMLANKASMASKCDAFDENPHQRMEHFRGLKAEICSQTEKLEENLTRKLSKGKSKLKFDSYKRKSEVTARSNKQDETLGRTDNLKSQSQRIRKKAFKVEVDYENENGTATLVEIRPSKNIRKQNKKLKLKIENKQSENQEDVKPTREDISMDIDIKPEIPKKRKEKSGKPIKKCKKRTIAAVKVA